VVDKKILKWVRNTKRVLLRGNYITFNEISIRKGLYRPFTKRFYFFERAFNEDVYRFPTIFPTLVSETENCIICVSDKGHRTSFSILLVNAIPEHHVLASLDASQCFPFYMYDEDGSNRRDNVTDWALDQFCNHYGDKKITKWDIFYYVYGLLHHPGYRERFADNLKRDLPRIPFAADFWTFAAAGQKLAQLHLEYEKLEPYPLKWIETPDVPLSYRVNDKMRLSGDKISLKVNDSLTLGGIPLEVFQYRLGNRSALEWVIDQYQVTQDKRSGIRSDPNRPDDEEYIVRLVGQVAHVSIETVNIVQGLPASFQS
jgi:predicted helicase